MALNDFADCDLDAVERPERPIPSGRVAPGEALALAAGLTATGLGLAAAAGGRRALRVAAPLAATVWAYDLAAKRTAAGPAAMALARGLDVLLGAGGRTPRAALPALALAGHTAGVTVLSRGEVHGGSRRAARAALAGTAGAAGVAVLAALRRPGRLRPPALPEGGARRVAGAALAAGAYAATVGRAQAAAVRSPADAPTVRAATGAGVRGCIGLQSALLAGAGAPVAAALVAAAGPLARLASKVVSPT
jgi:4-hydroxybenzoate polyprenyltransferase